jgi:hypothetical protein
MNILRKILTICIVIAFIFALAACGSAEGGPGGGGGGGDDNGETYTLNVSGTDLFSALQNLESGGTYIVNVTGNAAFPSEVWVEGDNFYNPAVTLTIQGTGTNTITGTEGIFDVTGGSTLTLKDITLIAGFDLYNSGGPCVKISYGSTLVLEDGAKITSQNDHRPGVWVEGMFTMNGGEIYGNAAYWGGGVRVADGGTFIMADGKIYGNTASDGGGVFVSTAGGSDGTFIMQGGEIYGNNATGDGGGVFVIGSFIMQGGAIYGNTAESTGGGVQVGDGGSFLKENGAIIYGSDDSGTNVVTPGNSYAPSNSGWGHAVFAGYPEISGQPLRYRDTTVGSGETLEITLNSSDGSISSQTGTWVTRNRDW